MPWVVPRTWSTGEQVKASYFNNVGASFAAAGNHKGWAAWTPVLGQGSVGNGSAVGRKLRVGDICIASFVLLYGSNGTGGASTAYNTTIVMPYSASTAVVNAACGFGYFYDNAADNLWTLVPFVFSDDELCFWARTTSTKGLRPGIPTAGGSYANAKLVGTIAYRAK